MLADVLEKYLNEAAGTYGGKLDEDHLVLDDVAEVHRRLRARVLAPAVLDLLVLGQRIGDQREDRDVVALHLAERLGGVLAHLGVGFEHAGVAAIIYTDIDRDGAMQGPNIEATVALARAVSIPVIVRFSANS